MHFLKLKPTLPYSLGNLSRSFLSLFSTIVSPYTLASPEHIPIIDYPNSNFKFSEVQSIYISKQLTKTRCPRNPSSVLNYFKQIGFSESQIQSLISRRPQLLFSRIGKTLKPKIDFLQLQGFEGSELGELLSKNSLLLTYGLNEKLVPLLETLRKIAYNKEDFFRVLCRSGSWKMANHQRILNNAAFLESCGIVGSHLSMLLSRQPFLFSAPESLVRNYVSRAVNMGFSINSGMLVHGLRTISGMNIVKFDRKLEIIQNCGFSKDETMQMFKRNPALLDRSEKRLKFKIEVFLNKIMLPKSVLINNPVILMLSLEKRVIPRWRVLQLLISKNLLEKNPSFFAVLKLREEKFLEKYISKFSDNEEALLEAYRSHHLEDAST